MLDPSDRCGPDPDDDPENERKFDEWMAEQQKQRDDLVAAACRFVDCNSIQSGLARISNSAPEKVVAVGPDQIRQLLMDYEIRPKGLDA